MSVRIRLARAGAKKAPFYRVVVADSRSPRDGRFIEILGRYNPRTQPSTIELNLEKVEQWISNGAEMTETTAKLYQIAKDAASSTSDPVSSE
ncbi:MAG: 30S ribosomal protein S16 [Actinobacteria bacterium]|nr:30S ribosomal protein S16 [Actinomycetota bacterium]